jgi:hypothetical protein
MACGDSTSDAVLRSQRARVWRPRREMDWTPPSWAGPPTRRLELVCTKEGAEMGATDISRERAYIFGRNPEGAPCGAVTLDHDSISRRHAALVHDGLQKKVQLVDLGSRHGTKLDGRPLAPRKYYELAEGAVVQFGASTRAYRLRSASQPQTGKAPVSHAVAVRAGFEAAAGMGNPPAAMPAGAGPAATIDLAALRKLGPGARTALTAAERAALEALDALDDDDDPMRNYVDNPHEFEPNVQASGPAGDGPRAAPKRERDGAKVAKAAGKADKAANADKKADKKADTAPKAKSHSKHEPKRSKHGHRDESAAHKPPSDKHAGKHGARDKESGKRRSSKPTGDARVKPKRDEPADGAAPSATR